MDFLAQCLFFHILPLSKAISILSDAAFKTKDRILSKTDFYKFKSCLKCPDLVLMHAKWHGFVLASLVFYYCYFPYEEAAALKAGWISKLILRDLVAMIIIFGGWEWVLYGKKSPWKQGFKPFKLNGRYPNDSQFYRDVLGTTSSTLISSVAEIYGLHLLYRENITYQGIDSIWGTIIMIQTFPYTRQLYFYITHRLIHPWRTKTIPDFGKYLYKYVHSYHHKSYLPTPWNGLSLHPVEGWINIAVIFLYIPLASYIGFHPFTITAFKYCITLSAAGSHDGFADPGLSNVFHHLHHELFDCNYGDNLFPFDKLFGTMKTVDDLEEKK